MNLFQKYKSLDIDGGLISLAHAAVLHSYFCYPEGAEPIGLEGPILYCFLPGYGVCRQPGKLRQQKCVSSCIELRGLYAFDSCLWLRQPC